MAWSVSASCRSAAARYSSRPSGQAPSTGRSRSASCVGVGRAFKQSFELAMPSQPEEIAFEPRAQLDLWFVAEFRACPVDIRDQVATGRLVELFVDWRRRAAQLDQEPRQRAEPGTGPGRDVVHVMR